MYIINLDTHFYQPSDASDESNLKVCLTSIFKVNYEGQVTYISHIEIPNIGYVQVDKNIVSLSRLGPTHDEQGVTISNSDLDFQGHPLRSSDKF